MRALDDGNGSLQKKIAIIIIIIKEAVFKSERTSSDNWGVFEKVAAQTADC